MNENRINMLVQDNDCHWYVIPVGMEEDFNKWLETEDPEPTWCNRVDNPHRVHFEDWWEV